MKKLLLIAALLTALPAHAIPTIPRSTIMDAPQAEPTKIKPTDALKNSEYDGVLIFEQADDATVLSPGTLYLMIQQTRHDTVIIATAQRQRIARLEARVTELERKMSGVNGKGGVQKQITVLHAKLKGAK